MFGATSTSLASTQRGAFRPVASTQGVRSSQDVRRPHVEQRVSFRVAQCTALLRLEFQYVAFQCQLILNELPCATGALCRPPISAGTPKHPRTQKQQGRHRMYRVISQMCRRDMFAHVVRAHALRRWQCPIRAHLNSPSLSLGRLRDVKITVAPMMHV